MNDVWEMLSQPFPPADLQWRVEALSQDQKWALVAPYLDARAVLDRLDEVVGTHGWQDSYEVLAKTGDSYAVKCRLVVMDVSKEEVGEGDSYKAAFSDALGRAAVKFGVGRFLYGVDKQWVDHDPETGKFDPPEVDLHLTPYRSLAAHTPPPHPEAHKLSPPSTVEAKPEPQELIDRLIERLKISGLGKQAAQIVVKYGGYGKHPDETRKLYGELRALLKGQAL